MAMPADFLVEQPTKFEYGQDAWRLGFDKLLGRVDGVIEYRRYLLQCGSPLLADTVAKVQSCRSANFRENTEREAIADSYNLNRVTEVACEFNVRR